jgi:hypothetical protein
MIVREMLAGTDARSGVMSMHFAVAGERESELAWHSGPDRNTM